MNTGNMQTSLLLMQWHQGNHDSLNQLLKRHYQWIHEQVRRRIGPVLRKKGDTTDYVQDAMVQFLKYGPRFVISDEHHFRSLLLRIVENAVKDKHDWFTARRRDIARENPIPADTVLSLDTFSGSDKSPSQYANDNEQEAWIRLGMEFIEPEDREIIVLHQWDDLSFIEIGEHLGISANAARKRHNRSVKRLAEIVWSLRKGDFTQILETSSD